MCWKKKSVNVWFRYTIPKIPYFGNFFKFYKFELKLKYLFTGKSYDKNMFYTIGAE